MKKLHNSHGFSIVEVMISIAVIGILGFVSYNVYSRVHDNKTASSATPTSQTASKQQSDTTAVPEVASSKDLDTVSSAVDKTNVDTASDDTQLDADLASF